MEPQQPDADVLQCGDGLGKPGTGITAGAHHLLEPRVAVPGLRAVLGRRHHGSARIGRGFASLETGLLHGRLRVYAPPRYQLPRPPAGPAGGSSP